MLNQHFTKGIGRIAQNRHKIEDEEKKLKIMPLANIHRDNGIFQKLVLVHEVEKW